VLMHEASSRIQWTLREVLSQHCRQKGIQSHDKI